jgi:hypothetical protein
MPAQPDTTKHATPPDTATLKLFRAPSGVPCLETEDRTWTDVRLVRCFPLSLPDEYVSVRDNEGEEIMLLRQLDDLPPESRKLADADLQDHYYMPVITRIREIADEHGIFRWDVETDQGEVTMRVRGRSENIERRANGHFIVTDVEGRRYEIPSAHELDPTSRQELETVA